MNKIDVKINTIRIKNEFKQILSDFINRNQIIEENECFYITSCDAEEFKELEKLEELEEEIFF